MTERAASGSAVEILLEAGAVLSSSLDLATTMQQVAALTVPRLADLCAIDLADPDGTIREVAVVTADATVAAGLEELRSRHPLDPHGGHPVARVIRSGEPELLPEMTHELLRSFAQGSEHAGFMIEHDYRSAIVAPLLARGRTLGAISTLRLGPSPPYRPEDQELVCELARRAALAIDNARLFSELRAVEQRLEAILVNVAEAITVVDGRGRTVFANEAAVELLGASSAEELVDGQPGAIMSRFLVLDEEGNELDLDDMPARRLLRGEPAEPLLVRNIVRTTGEERWLNVRSSAIADPVSGGIAYVVNIYENLTDVKRAQVAESFMSEVGRVLASSMDYAETLRRVAELAVPRVADWCAVDVVDERGNIERMAIHHRDSERLAAAVALEREYPRSLSQARAVPEVIRSGTTRVITDIPPQALEKYASDARHLELLRAVAPTAMVIVPMIGAGGPIGAITLATTESLRRLGEADVALAERLAHRAGTAVENARLYTARTRIAQTLQRALLPESLPEIDGIELSALYEPAGVLNEVGGDFYDAFRDGRGRWVLVIGDVCGKGARAAGVTALARYTLRAAAMSGEPPVGMLAMLDRALREQPPTADFCTVCLMTIELEEELARLTTVLAGHHHPLLVDASGEVRRLGALGTALGVLERFELQEDQSTLAPSETLLLYTDGVSDAGRSRGQLGEDGVARLAARAPELALDELLALVQREALARASGQLRDDLAIVGARLQPRAAR